MSTERSAGRREARMRKGRRRFAAAFAVVVGVLVAAVAAGSVVSLTQGPRVSSVVVDPQAAAESSGSRVILTANQALAEVSHDQVEVTPAVPFTVDAAGREIGVRFTAPLDDDTEYRISVPGVRAVGGGPAATLETDFRTPPTSVLLLERTEGDDAIYRTELDGADRETVFASPEIDDFRSAAGMIVASIRDPDGSASLIRMNDDGSGAEEFALPGDGTIRNLQLSERGGRIGYTYTDLPASQGEAPEREAQLFTASLRAPGDEPVAVAVAGEVPSVDKWQFVPDSSAILLIDFTGELVLVEPGSDSEPGVLGSAIDIDAVARGTYTAIVERLEDGMVWIDLATGDEKPLVAPDPEPGLLGNVLPMPSAAGDAGGVDSVRQYTVLGDDGVPTSQQVTFVAADGAAREVLTVDMPEALLQTCLSPSARYVAATVAADLASNPYDTMSLPMPAQVDTLVYDIDSGEQVATLPGFDVSWCAAGP
ncbi:Ig-like domain-containing protein [Microbacterium halotolerans]|uniref:Ig-like domain-containing protein n=1 Tax=Microbacterium halotolerans TaxID=246613 RepID=UPI0019693091|nr:Ig-like domain-containing protein [Microbacterium halotolerans]